MHLLLDIVLTLLSIFIVFIHGRAAKTHFQSRVVPGGAKLLVTAVLVTLAVFLVLLWTNHAPVGAHLAALALEALSLWLFYRTIAASRGSSPSSGSPFGIDHAPRSFFAQNGPPGWTRKTSRPSPRRR